MTGKFGWYDQGYTRTIQLFVIVLPQTYVSVYHCYISGMVEQLPVYEDVTTLESVVVQRDLGDFVYVCDRNIGLVRPGVCRYHPIFWHFFPLDLYARILLW